MLDLFESSWYNNCVRPLGVCVFCCVPSVTHVLDFRRGDFVEPSNYISIIMMFAVLLIVLRRRNRIIIEKVINNKRIKGVNTEMRELAERFIEKECLIYSFDGNQYRGVIKEVANGAILVEKDEKLEAINLDFIIRIREYPRSKNGKKKSVVLD